MSAAAQPHGYHQAPQGNGANAERRQEQLPLVLIPSTWDVLFGRGMPIHQRPGNVRFHRILHPLRERYKNDPRDQKAAIVQQAIAVITSNWMIPPGTATTRVRFLKRAPTNEYENLVQGQGNEDDEDEEEEEEDALRTLQWVEATEAEAFEKVRHVLRDPKPAARMAAQAQMQMQHTTAAAATFPTATYVPVMTNGFVMVPAAAPFGHVNPNMIVMIGNVNPNMILLNGHVNPGTIFFSGNTSPRTVTTNNYTSNTPAGGEGTTASPMVHLDFSRQYSSEQREGESPKKGEHKGDNAITVQPKDVLFGKGRAKNFHPGNIRFRELLLKSFQQSYVDAARREKQEIIARAWDAIQRDGEIGRFLKQDGNEWKEATEQEIKGKIDKVLRQPYQAKKRRRTIVESDERPSDIRMGQISKAGTQEEVQENDPLNNGKLSAEMAFARWEFDDFSLCSFPE